MKKLLFTLSLLLIAVSPVLAQNGIIRASSSDCATVNSCVTLNTNPDRGGTTIQITGTFSATIEFEATVNGGTWVSISGTVPGTGSSATAATDAGVWQFSTAGFAAIRARASSYSSGGANVLIQSSAASPSGSTTITGDVMLDTTGLATATKQDTGNTSLGSIDTKLSSQATAAKQDTGNTSLSTIGTNTGTVATNTTALAARTADCDTGGGTQTCVLMGVAVPASGGAVAASSANPFPVAIISGAGTGGTALDDGDNFTPGTTAATPVGGVYESSPSTCADGKGCAVGITTNREFKVAVTSISAAATGQQNNAGSDSVVISSEQVGTAGTPSAAVMSVQGIASMTPVQVSQATASNLNATVVQGTATNLKAQAEVYQGGSAVGTGNPLQVTLANNGANATAVKVNVASGGIASGAVASGAVASGAFASGAIGSGAVASGAFASGSIGSGAIASGAVASGAIASGAFAAGSLNSALPDPCLTTAKIFIPISQTTGTELFTGTASNRTYICSIMLNQPSASTQTFSLVSGTGSVCATSTGAMIGATSAANGMELPFAFGNGLGSVAKSDTDADNVCLLQSSTDRISGVLSYVVAPN